MESHFDKDVFLKNALATFRLAGWNESTKPAFFMKTGDDVILSRKRKPYRECGERQKSRTQAVYRSIVEVIGMKPEEALSYSLSIQFLGSGIVR